MMFLNLALLQNNSYYAGVNTVQSHCSNDYKVLPNNFLNKRIKLAYIFQIPEVISESKQVISEKRLFKTRITNELFRHLWQQNIFLSINYKSLSKYNMDVNSVNIVKHQKKQKSLLSKFSKSLFSGSIQCSLTSSLSTSKKSFIIVNYSWSKVLRRQILKVQNLFVNSCYINNLQNLLNNRINTKCLPVFTISNHLGQMIISEPSRSFFGTQYIKNSENIINKMYYGFFFLNYEDAQEYLQYVQHKYNLKNESLNIFSCNLSIFYNMMETFSKEISFRLIPDLKEISSLIKESRYRKYLIFHKKQKKGRNFFQGQPLYSVQYNNSYLCHVISDKKYTLLFTNYDEALKIANMLQNNSSPSLSQRPKFIVYNLEKFINDQLAQDTNSKENFFIIPSKSSYLFTKKYHLYSSGQLVRNQCVESLSCINLWIKRVFWSLTSRKPV